MLPLEKKTLKIIMREGLLQGPEKVVVGVSAGPDSMALLHVLARLMPILDITPAAAYVNHGLRPEAAERERCLVAAAAARLGIDFFSGPVDVLGLAAKQKLSIEHAARLLRYDFLEKTARKWGALKIALAHTADDQAEEILLRLLRGTARKGLSGMKTLRAGRFIRPFLGFPKSDLLEYLERNEIPFTLDASNRQNLYLRNRIRNDLLPYLAERYNPDIRQTLLRTAIILQDEEEVLERLTETAFAEIDRTPPGSPACPETLHLNLELFGKQPRAIQRRLLEKCCWLMACKPGSRQIEDLLHLGIAGSPGSKLHLADGLRVRRSRMELCFGYPRGQGPLRGDLAAGSGPGVSETAIPSAGIYEFPALQKKLILEEIQGFLPASGDNFPDGEHLDADLFSFPLTIRSPKAGDRFHPLGSPGSRKVNDFLSDRKIEKNLRPQMPILCADGMIIALPGLRIDHRYRVTGKTTRVIRVRWEEMV